MTRSTRSFVAPPLGRMAPVQVGFLLVRPGQRQGRSPTAARRMN